MEARECNEYGNEGVLVIETVGKNGGDKDPEYMDKEEGEDHGYTGPNGECNEFDND